MVTLSDGEWKIMNLLWEGAPYTITQIVSELKDETGWSKNTVITMLGRLEKKKAVYYEQGERAKQYYPLINQDEMSIEETNNFLKKVYSGSIKLMLNEFVSKQKLSKNERAELLDILKNGEGD